MSLDLDPHIDGVAAARWAAMPAPQAPWLHGEVGRRMAERLEVIKMPTHNWTNWSWQRGGEGLGQAQSKGFGVLRRLSNLFQLRLPQPKFRPPTDGSQDVIWSNMQLHMEAAPKRLMEAWHAALKTDGFVMFSCLGPDTLMELRAAYQRLGWPAPLHTLTDMHDWGDRLVAQGFAQPVMDMERLILTFSSPERAVQELRELGRNLHPQRAAKTQSKAWRACLLQALSECRNAQGQIALTFELIYGHAIKPKPRATMSSSASISLVQMRAMLREGNS